MCLLIEDTTFLKHFVPKNTEFTAQISQMLFSNIELTRCFMHGFVEKTFNICLRNVVSCHVLASLLIQWGYSTAAIKGKLGTYLGKFENRLAFKLVVKVEVHFFLILLHTSSLGREDTNAGNIYFFISSQQIMHSCFGLLFSSS